jgi:hypothetical protein
MWLQLGRVQVSNGANNDGTYVCSVVRKAEKKRREMNKQNLIHFYAV